MNSFDDLLFAKYTPKLYWKKISLPQSKPIFPAVY